VSAAACAGNGNAVDGAGSPPASSAPGERSGGSATGGSTTGLAGKADAGHREGTNPGGKPTNVTPDASGEQTADGAGPGAPLAATAFSIVSPMNGASVSGMVSIHGAAGAAWVNVAAFDPSDNYAKVAADVVPQGGAFSLALDTTQFANGMVTIAVMAFSVPAGGTGGTSSEIDLALTVDNSSGGTNPPPGGGPTYYVSPNGNDSNSGTSEADAWQTVAPVNAGQFAAGTSILFQGGARFSGCLSLSGSNFGGTASAPVTIGSYGTGKFTLAANCSGAQASAVHISAVNYLVLQDCILTGNQGGAEYGVWVNNYTSAATTGVTIQNCDISGFYTTSTNDYGAEIFVTGDSGGGLHNLSILNNTLHGSSGVTSPDDNGISGYGGGENLTGLLYHGNLVYDIGGKPNAFGGAEANGIVVNGGDGAVVEYNVVHDIGANTNTCGGPSGFMAYTSNNVTFRYNEAYNVRPVPYTGGCDWDGFDMDGAVTNSVEEYNYSHDNYGGGVGGWMGTVGSQGWGPNVIRFNISENDGQINTINSTTGYGGLCLGGPWLSQGEAPPPTHVDVYNNTIYNSVAAGSPFAFGGTVPTSGVVANNVFYGTGEVNGQSNIISIAPNYITPSGLTFIDNDYYGSGALVFQWNATGAGVSYAGVGAWQAATGQDPKAHSLNPELDAPGGATACGGYTTSCPSAYKLAQASPLMGIGLDLTAAPYSMSMGTEDFFGNPLPGSAGSGYNIGAY
jgi:hypothetical protein